METDKITLYDLAIFQKEEEISVFHKLNFTRTSGGQDKFRDCFKKSLHDLPSIRNVQQTLRLLLDKKEAWPLSIGNGTIMVIH